MTINTLSACVCIVAPVITVGIYIYIFFVRNPIIHVEAECSWDMVQDVF